MAPRKPTTITAGLEKTLRVLRKSNRLSPEHEALISLARGLAAAGDLGERLRAGRREERFRFTTDLDNFFRRPWGQGWALVGDAGYHKNPLTAQGMTDAFRDAELVANALHPASPVRHRR